VPRASDFARVRSRAPACLSFAVRVPPGRAAVAGRPRAVAGADLPPVCLRWEGATVGGVRVEANGISLLVGVGARG
jgi:hypothetical protein